MEGAPESPPPASDGHKRSDQGGWGWIAGLALVGFFALNNFCTSDEPPPTSRPRPTMAATTYPPPTEPTTTMATTTTRRTTTTVTTWSANDQEDATFTVALNTNAATDVFEWYPRVELVKLGRSVCSELQAGASMVEVFLELDNVFGEWDTGVFIGASITAFCPEVQERVEAEIEEFEQLFG